MCNVGSLFAVAGAATEAAGLIVKGEAEGQQDEFKAAIYGMNADIAESNAGLLRNEAAITADGANIATAKAALTESRIRRTGVEVAAAQRLDFTSRHLDPSVGSPLVLAGMAASQVQADIDLTRATGAMDYADAISRSASLVNQALGAEGQVFTARMSGRAALLHASNARLAGYIGAGTALLKGAAAAYNTGGGPPGMPVPG